MQKKQWHPSNLWANSKRRVCSLYSLVWSFIPVFWNNCLVNNSFLYFSTTFPSTLHETFLSKSFSTQLVYDIFLLSFHSISYLEHLHQYHQSFLLVVRLPASIYLDYSSCYCRNLSLESRLLTQHLWLTHKKLILISTKRKLFPPPTLAHDWTRKLPRNAILWYHQHLTLPI